MTGALRFVELLFDTWVGLDNPYLDDIIKEHELNESKYVIKNHSKPMWNIKPISTPTFPWILENVYSDPERLLNHLQHIKEGLYWFQNMSPQWIGANEGKSDQSCVIVGDILNAPVRSNKLLLGMMFIEGNNYYPAHAHDAKEFYYIVAGTCFVKTKNSHYEEKRAGDIVIHEPNEVHALKTKSESVLIVWGNTGNIHGHYYYLNE